MNRKLSARVWIPLCLLCAAWSGALIADCVWNCGTNATCNKPNVIIGGTCAIGSCPSGAIWQYIYNPGTALIIARFGSGDQDSGASPDVACWMTQQASCSTRINATCGPNPSSILFCTDAKACCPCDPTMMWCPSTCTRGTAFGPWYAFRISNYTCATCPG